MPDGSGQELYNDLKPETQCPESMLNTQTFKKREQTLKAIDAINLDQQSADPGQALVDQFPLDLRQLLDFDAESLRSMHYLMNLNNYLYGKFQDTYAFLNKRKFSTAKQDTRIENLNFSKNFFDIMDEDMGGSISLKELTYPLIALGLANDSEFVKKSLSMINPEKFSGNDYSAEIDLREFTKIFQIDPI